MDLLLDTHTIIWLMADVDRVPAATVKKMQGSDVGLFLSSISVWEIHQKYRLGKLKMDREPHVMIAEAREAFAIEPLPFDAQDCIFLAQLPPLHKDPFDRMLICQAIHHGLAIVTDDCYIARYPVRIIWQ